MNILAVDTATEQCSAAIVSDARDWLRAAPTARGHADLILPMVDELLRESGYSLADMDALAFGRGPGSFTGVRIAVGVIQGLALASGKSVVGVSNLAAVAQRALAKYRLPADATILVCMDARMREVYWAMYRVNEAGTVELVGDERVGSPEAVNADAASISLGVGTGWAAYERLRARYPALRIDDSVLPCAREVAQLARIEFDRGHAVAAALAQPVYLRDQVVSVR